MSTPPVPDDVLRAARRIEGLVHRTPVFTSSSLDRELGGELFFKAETLQRTGAFKARGASHAICRLDEESARRGVATHSSGNHGAALAWAASSRGIPCRVVMPEGSTRAKRAAVERYGAEVVECAPTQAAREATAARVVAETGARLVHPYDDPEVIAGQGTCGLEMAEQIEGLDLVVTPLGGGGLLAGTVLGLAAVAPSVEAIGVEPSGADDARRSLLAGTIQPLAVVDTIADGLRATVGRLPFQVLASRGTRVEIVDDEAIRRAQRRVSMQLKLVVEPSAVVGLAAILEGSIDVRGRRVGIVLTGGNIDPE